MVSASASRVTPRRPYKSWLMIPVSSGLRGFWGSVLRAGGSRLVEDPGDVARDGAHRCHRPGVVHAGRADDAEGREGFVARAVAGGDDAGGGQLLVGTLGADRHRECAARGCLAEQ